MRSYDYVKCDDRYEHDCLSPREREESDREHRLAIHDDADSLLEWAECELDMEVEA
jgi:hypothetical protein